MKNKKKIERLNYFVQELSPKVIPILKFWDYYHYDKLCNYFQCRIAGKLDRITLRDIDYSIEQLELSLRKYNEHL